MQLRNLLMLILKVMGLFFLKDIVLALPQLFSALMFLIAGDAYGMGISSGAVLLLSFLIYGWLAYYLIFKTDYVLQKLRLANGLEGEKISIQTNSRTVISICIILLGGFLLLNEVPTLLAQVYERWADPRPADFVGRTNTPYLIGSIVRLIIGLLLLGKHQKIADYMESRQKLEQDDESATLS